MADSSGIPVLQLISGLARGGAESALLRLCQELPAQGYRPIVASLSEGGELAPGFAEAGIDIEVLSVSSALSLVPTAARIASLCRKRGIRLVQSWMYHADLVAALVGVLAPDLKIVWNIRHGQSGKGIDKRRTMLVRKANALLSWFATDAIVCCAKSAESSHLSDLYDGSKFVIIPNGVDTIRFTPSPEKRAIQRRALGIDEHAPVIGMVARFNPQKNHTGFLKSCGAIAAARPDARFVLVGPGVDAANSELGHLIGQLGLQARVALLGSRADIESIYPVMDIHVMASTHGEAFPNVVAESMSCGIPNVVSDCGDAGIIVDSLGVVAPNDSQLASRLAQGCLQLLANSPAPSALHFSIADRFSMLTMARSYAALYTRLGA